jgi:hypothetical protein
MESKSVVPKTEKHWRFFVGDQWHGLKSGGEDFPMMNFIKPIVQYKVSSVAQNSMTAVYADMNHRTELTEVYEKLNKYWEQCWEKSKMTNVGWRVLKTAAIQGDTYTYWKDGNTLEPPQMLSNTAVFLADENIDDIQNQPFIIVYERWSLEAAKEHAKANGVSEEEIKLITPDDKTETQIYNKKEVEDKVTVLFYLEKKGGKVHAGRATESVVIEPVEIIQGEKGGFNEETVAMKALSVYPIIPYVWENVPNTARGVGEVEQLIPNQLEANKTLARRAMAVKMGAYPRLAYDANAIENPEDLENVGSAIAVQGGGSQSINQMISYLNPANISSDADNLFNTLVQMSKDLAGATDYALGNINPEQASGTAIIAVRDQAQVPLNEQVARYRQWVEDVSLLWMDLWISYNPDGIDFEIEDEMGNATPMHIDQSELEKLKPTVRIDVSPDNQWTKLAEQQSLDGMLQNGLITLDEFADMVPDNSSVPKQKLLQVIEKRQAKQQEMMQQQMMQGGMPPQQPVTDIDPQLVAQELLAQGIPEDEVQAIIQSL